MKALDNFLNRVGTDKVLHLLVGAWICAIISFVTILQESNLAWWQTILMPAIGTIVAILVSVVKELFFDETPDWKDVLWTLYGCLTVFGAVSFGILFKIWGQ